MKNKLILTAGLFLCAFLRSNAQYASSVEYNNFIISTTDSLYKYGQNWGLELQNSYKTKDYSQLWKARERMDKLIIRKRAEMVELQELGVDSKPFRLAMIDFLDFEKEMVLKAFVPFEKLTSKNSEQDFQATMGNLNSVALVESDYLKKLHAAQDEYAAKNGFYIKRN